MANTGEELQTETFTVGPTHEDIELARRLSPILMHDFKIIFREELRAFEERMMERFEERMEKKYKAIQEDEKTKAHRNLIPVIIGYLSIMASIAWFALYLHGEIKATRDELKADMKVMHDELKADMKVMHDELREDIKATREDIKATREDIKATHDRINSLEGYMLQYLPQKQPKQLTPVR